MRQSSETPNIPKEPNFLNKKIPKKNKMRKDTIPNVRNSRKAKITKVLQIPKNQNPE